MLYYAYTLYSDDQLYVKISLTLKSITFTMFEIWKSISETTTKEKAFTLRFFFTANEIFFFNKMSCHTEQQSKKKKKSSNKTVFIIDLQMKNKEQSNEQKAVDKWKRWWK